MLDATSDATAHDPAPPVTGMPRLLLRLEGAALVGGAVVFYPHTGGTWPLFAILVLAPDLSLLAYLAGPRIGALAYNAAHTTLGPIALTLIGLYGSSYVAIGVALIWLTHIGADRMLGYGLKYEAGFAFTHLGRVGRRPKP
jgi:Domain of unknown function (DUF4260)